MSTDANHSSTIVPLPRSLPADAAEWEQLVRQLVAREQQLTAALAESSETVSQQQQLLEKLAHELALLKRALFGSRKERFGDDPNQKLLFEGRAEQPAEAPVPDNIAVEIADDAPAGKRKGHGRRPLPQFLPRKQVEHTLPGEELGCPCCGNARG